MLRRGVIAIALCGLAGCGSPTGRGIRVAAAENFYGNIVSQVAGSHVAVTSIIRDPAADPHEYTGSVTDTQAVAQARLVVVNGAGYDSFMSRLIDATPSADRVVVHVDRLVRAVGGNPHLWYDPSTAAAVARAAAAELARIDRAGATAYRAGAARFVASLSPVRAEITSLRARFQGAPFAYTEGVPGYLTALIGLRLMTPTAFSNADEQGTDPPPQSVATMRALVTEHRIRLLLYNSQASSPAAANIRDLARSAGVPVVGVSETMPPGSTYQRWQLAQLRAIDRELSR